jgi:hypothetical protein
MPTSQIPPAVVQSDEVEVVPETQLELNSAAETQVVPETQFDNDLELDSDANPRDDAVMSSTARVLTSTNSTPETSHQEPVQLDFFLSRPKSSGQDLSSGFVFKKAPPPVLNFSREKQQHTQITTSPKLATRSSNQTLGKIIIVISYYLMLTRLDTGDDRTEVLGHLHRHRHPIPPASSFSMQTKMPPPPLPSNVIGKPFNPLPDVLSKETDRMVEWKTKPHDRNDISSSNDLAQASSEGGISQEFSERGETNRLASPTGPAMKDHIPQYVPMHPWHLNHLTVVS